MLYNTGEINNIQWGIWKIDETNEELYSRLDNKENVSDILKIKSDKKICERLAVRVLLKHLTGKESVINYHPSGRPYLDNCPINISISHTKGFVSLLLTEMEYAGIDIQAYTNKIFNIRPRFLSGKEYIDTNAELTHLLLHWSAKESVYKSLGIAGISLVNNIYIDHFIPSFCGTFYAEENITTKKLKFEIKYKVDKDFVLTTISDYHTNTQKPHNKTIRNDLK